MLRLHHQTLCPFSRKVRVVLSEKKIPFELREEPVWRRDPAFLSLNPAGCVPVIVEADGEVTCDSQTIVEYIEETFPEPSILGATPRERAEARRLAAWFDCKFDEEVTRLLVGEKVVKRLASAGSPDSSAIRAGKTNMAIHLDYIAFLSERRRWLAGDSFSLADIAAAAHISCIDYLGDVPWERHEVAKDWYSRMKSRPSIRPLLSDVIPGVNPNSTYADLDF